MKRLFLCFIAIFFTSALCADDLSIFREYTQKADTAFKHGDTELCFRINEDIITIFNSNRNNYVKNKEICTLVFNAYSSLAILDKRKNEKEVCSLLVNGLELVEDNPLWLKNYMHKNHIVQCYVILVGRYSELGNIESACTYNQKMITFAENHYRFEIANVLLTACSMYSLMNMLDKSYPLYHRLYRMIDELDRRQQYKVVRELIHFEFTKENYAELSELAIKHEKLIANSKDEIKESILTLICLGFIRNANKIAQKYEGKYSTVVDDAFKTGCEWAFRNDPRLYPMNCINYAYWLYRFDECKFKAIEQFKAYLETVENIEEENIFDQKSRLIEDAENALISIMVQTIVRAENPSDLNYILSNYPKVVSAIRNNPSSEYYEDFVNTVKLSRKICYGTE